MTDQTRIRKIEITDVANITELNQELGYKTSRSIVESQINTILSDENHHVLVAVHDDQVIGYIHGFISIRLTAEPFLEIGGLVVKENYRKQGIGRKLVVRLEQHIQEVEKVRVRCNLKRKSAHDFYLALNYQELKEQKIFEKTL